MSWDLGGEDDETSTSTTATSATTVTPFRRGRGRPKKNQPKVGASWDLMDPDFDPDLFYTRATDPSGLIGHVLHVKVPPDIAAHLSRLVQSGKIPAFKSNGDIVRHYLVVGLHDLSQKEEDPKFAELLQDMLRDVTAAQRASDYIASLERFKSIVDSLDKMARLAHQMNDYRAFSAQLDNLSDLAEKYREPLRSQLLTKISEHASRVSTQVEPVPVPNLF